MSGSSKRSEKYAMTLPDEAVLDNFAKSLARMANAV
jgi:hypothetical protein